MRECGGVSSARRQRNRKHETCGEDNNSTKARCAGSAARGVQILLRCPFMPRAVHG